MAVLVENIRIKNLKNGDTKSDSDIIYPDNDAKIFERGWVSRESLMNDSTLVSSYKMVYRAFAFNSIINSFPIFSLTF